VKSMFRRTLLKAVCSCSLPTSLAAQPAVSSSPTIAPRVFGCCIPRLIAPAYFARAIPSPSIEAPEIDIRRLVTNSSSRDFDFALAQTLGMLCDRFDVLPNFSYYREVENDENALATEEPFGSHPDGTVLLGLRMVGTLMRRTENGAASVIAVVAHEFGHIVANKLKLNDRLAPEKTKPFRAEQFADFMSGAFAAVRQKEYDRFPAAAFALTMWDLGGSDRGTHGTREERGNAVSAGYQDGSKSDITLNNIVTAGFQYAMSVR
jgi:hypothetical protein